MSNLIPIVIAAALAIAPTLAYAEPPPEPKSNPSSEDLDRAKELFENGKALYSEGSYDTAIAAFKRAYANSGDPVLLYNIALAYDRAGDFDGALEYLEYYRAFAPESEREALAEKEESLRKRQLRAKTSGGTTESSPDDESNATEDGETGGTDPAPRDTSALDDDGSKKPKNQQKIFTVPVWVLTGVAVAGIGVGTGLGVTALNRRSDADDACADGGLCSASGKDDAESARKLAIGSDVAFAVGATAGVVAIALIINNAVKRRKANRTSTAMVPVRGGAGLAVRF